MKVRLPLLASEEERRAREAAEVQRQEEGTARWLDRRGFMVVMGSAVALGAAACTRQPAEQIVPYVKGPEDLVPGRPLFFATGHLLGGVATGVLVESHAGRPTKVEGNPEHPASLGATDVFAQASIMDLYDPDRAQAVTHLGEITAWGSFVSAMQVQAGVQRGKRGKGLRILTGAVASPSVHAHITSLLASMPLAKWHWYEPISRASARQGAMSSFGADLEPRYHLDRADVIVSLGADFLSATEGNVRYVRDFTKKRRSGAVGRPMNRLYAVEVTPGLTGASADHRLAVRPGHLPEVAWALAGILGVPLRDKVTRPGKEQTFLEAVARDLLDHKGKSLVIAGEHEPPVVHALANAMNVLLGNVGGAVVYQTPVVLGPLDPVASLRELAADLDQGEVELLIIAGANPVLTAPADIDFANKIKRAKLRVYLGTHADETAALCHFHIPAAHPLESWGDVRSYDGTITWLQPLIEPLYGGKHLHEVLAALGERPDQKVLDLIRAHYQDQLKTDAAFRASLHAGFLAGSAFLPSTPDRKPLDELTRPPMAADGAFDVVFRPDPSVYDGRYGNNAWLQELPRPLTKMVWDNAAILAPETAKELGVGEGDLVSITLDKRTIQAPVWPMPGQPPRTVTLHLGYGRDHGGRVARGAGFNAYPLRTSSALSAARGAEVRATGGHYELVTTQTHHSMEGRDIIRSGRAADYQKALGVADPHEQKKLAEAAFGVHEHERLSLYPKHDYPGYSWGMSIDLNSCVGCMACVVACQSENNIPVVGKEEVKTGREMHWIRVDRYYEESPSGELATLFQPIPCMHCENAPCEVVCPVAATVHHAEGMNDMVYNRCVGTKYCSNNCPYKVRRYNFFGYAKEAISPLDPSAPVLTLMRNPDVTVRSYGVMEKCSYCVQRVNYARIEAKKQDRRIHDGDVMTACQAVCPASAIVFGDMNDRASEVARKKSEPRSYALLAELNTEPHTTYLANLTNPNPALAGAHDGGGPQTPAPKPHHHGENQRGSERDGEPT